VAIAVTVVSWIFVVCFRKTAIVAMAQPVMLSMLCVGSLMILTGNVLSVLFSFPKNNSTAGWNAYCSGAFWVCWLGVITILSALVFKLYRVFKISSSRWGRGVLSRYILGPFVLLVMLGIYANIAIHVVYPPDYAIVEIPNGDSDGETTLHGMCYPMGSVAMKAGIIAQVFLEIPLIIAIMFFAWKLRDLNEQIGESRRIFHLASFTVIVYVLYWLLFFIRKADIGLGPKERVYMGYTTYTIAYILYATSPVGFLIFPRMYYVWYEHAHGHLPEHLRVGGTASGSERSSVGDTEVSHTSVAHTPNEEKDTEKNTGKKKIIVDVESGEIRSS